MFILIKTLCISFTLLIILNIAAFAQSNSFDTKYSHAVYQYLEHYSQIEKCKIELEGKFYVIDITAGELGMSVYELPDKKIPHNEMVEKILRAVYEDISLCNKEPSIQVQWNRAREDLKKTSRILEEIQEDPNACFGLYSVRFGDTFKEIAQEFKVLWYEVAVLNHSALKNNFLTKCKNKKTLKENVYYCNSNKDKTLKHGGMELLYAHTLDVGMKLHIPKECKAIAAPNDKVIEDKVPEPSKNVIEHVVEQIKEKNVVFVIDDSGSMDFNRANTINIYMKAFQKYNTQIKSILLYSDNRYDIINPQDTEQKAVSFTTGDLPLQTRGGSENTIHALLLAKELNPDVIILITDEDADDWDRTKLQGLPPVIATCLPFDLVKVKALYNQMGYSTISPGDQTGCEEHLSIIAQDTLGYYVTLVKGVYYSWQFDPKENKFIETNIFK